MSSHQPYHQQTLSVDGSVISHEEFPTTHTHTHTHSLSLSLSLSLSACLVRALGYRDLHVPKATEQAGRRAEAGHSRSPVCLLLQVLK